MHINFFIFFSAVLFFGFSYYALAALPSNFQGCLVDSSLKPIGYADICVGNICVKSIPAGLFVGLVPSGSYVTTIKKAGYIDLTLPSQYFPSGGVVSFGSNGNCKVIQEANNCGTSNGQSFLSAPTSGLCTNGTIPAISGAGPWTWTCGTASCSASLSNNCGTSNGQSFASTPSSGLCTDGSSPAVNGTGPWTWDCSGTSCSANLCTGILFGSSCVTNSCAPVIQNSNLQYSCAASETLVGSNCDYASAVNYSCPSGGSLSGTTCTKPSNYAASYTCGSSIIGSIWTSWADPGGYPNYGWSFIGPGLSGTCASNGGSIIGKFYVYGWWLVCGACGYSCPSGGSLSGSTCYNNSTYAATPVYTCPSGGILNGTTCSHSATPVYACSNVCSSLYNNAQASFTSSDSSCTSPINAPTYSLNCDCGVSPTKTDLSGINYSSCSLCTSVPTDGVCGSDHNVQSATMPISNLCGNGTIASSVSGDGSTLIPWTWTCTGIRGSTVVANCQTTKLPPSPGVCGSDNGKTGLISPPTALCNVGLANPTSLIGAGPWSWTCTLDSEVSCGASNVGSAEIKSWREVAP